MINNKTPEKRRFSFFPKTLQSCVEPVVRPVIRAQGVAASAIIKEWEKIVGKELAAHSYPLKLSFPKDSKANGTLLVACVGAHALTLQHLQPVIIERIAGYFGYKAVARITIEQRALHATTTVSKKSSVTQKPPKTMNVSCLADVDDAELREALSSLAKTFATPTMSS